MNWDQVFDIDNRSENLCEFYVNYFGITWNTTTPTPELDSFSYKKPADF